jgi:hypothetical protein
MKIELNDQQMDYVVNVLAARPYSEVFQLLENLRQQVQQEKQHANDAPTGYVAPTRDAATRATARDASAGAGYGPNGASHVAAAADDAAASGSRS